MVLEPPHSPLTTSANHTQQLFTKTKQVLFDLEHSYIYQVSINFDSSRIAASGSNHQIKIYDPHLTLASCLTGHTNTISAIQFDPIDPNLLFSTDADGHTYSWDLRLTPVQPVLQMTQFCPCRYRPFPACWQLVPSLREADASIHFYDLRAPKLMHSYTESHSDDIVQLAFHPHIKNRILSGSTDGIANIFDINTWDEDDDLTASMPSNSSVSQVGWFGAMGECVWMTTHTETVSVWSADGDLLKKFGDIRQYSSAHVPIDYVVNFQFDPADERLYLVTGSHSGTISVISASMTNLEPYFTSGNGHSDVIRTTIVDFGNGRIISGGEDSLLTMWESGNLTSAAEHNYMTNFNDVSSEYLPNPIYRGISKTNDELYFKKGLPYFRS